MSSTYGGVLVDARHRILVRKPRGDRHGWTFAQGPALSGEHPEAAALRVVATLTGYRARITAALEETFEGPGGPSLYWILHPLSHDRFSFEETEAVTWVSPIEAKRLLSQTRHPADRTRDLSVLAAVVNGWRP